MSQTTSTAKYNWYPRSRNAKEELQQLQKPDTPTSTHPLQDAQHDEKPKQQKSDDPLSDDFHDPLLNPKEETKTVAIFGPLNRALLRMSKSTFLNWNAKKTGYLKKYTTDKNIPVTSSLVDEDETDKVPLKVEERARIRLEQIEKEDKEKDLHYMTQKDYIKWLESQNSELIASWEGDNRVKALRIVIKCTKKLIRNKVPQFYPSLFVLVSQVLDTFGGLVYERLKDKSVIVDKFTGRVVSKLPRDFTAKDVTPEAQEICKNWLYKIYCIRELICRIYVEMALLSTYRFLLDSEEELIKHFYRIARTIRGIGDPLIATYARCYLARKGVELIPREKRYLILCFDDFLTTLKQWEDSAFIDTIKNAGMEMHQYLDLYSPAIEWILEALGNHGDEKLFHQLLQKYESLSKKSMVLNHLINAFDPQIISNNASVLVYLILQCDDKVLPKSHLFRSLGEKFVLYPPAEKDKLRLLNEVWKYVTKIENIEEYVNVFEVWANYISKCFTMREINILFGDLRKHLKNVKSVETIEMGLQNALLAVLENTDDFTTVFNMDHFLPVFDLLKTKTRVEVSKGMLAAFGRRERTKADPVMVNALFDLAKTVHDSMDNLIAEDERQHISDIITTFIKKIDFGTQFEIQLNFIQDCRRAFSNLDAVKQALIMEVLMIIAKTFNIVKGKHTSKTLGFIKACFAFCHISIPSIEDIFKRLHLYFLTGQLALMNNLLPQADMLFKTAIESISDIPTLITLENNVVVDTEQETVSFINELISCLIAVPGHPEYGPFYLLRGLLNVVQAYKWQKGSNARIIIYTNVLAALAAFSQETLPYNFEGVNSNDSLYMEDTAYKNDVRNIGNKVLEEILNDLTTLGKDTDVAAQKKQAMGALDLFNNIIAYSDLNPKILTLAYNLFNLAKKNEDIGVQTYLNNSLQFLKTIKHSTVQQLYTKLSKS